MTVSLDPSGMILSLSRRMSLTFFLQRVPEVVLGGAGNGRGRIVAAARSAATTSDATTGRCDLGVDRDRTAHVARHVDIVNPVGAQEGRIRHHHQIGAVELPAHVDLFGDAREDLLERLVDGVDGDDAVDPWVDIDIEFGIPSEGEEQILNRNVAY